MIEGACVMLQGNIHNAEDLEILGRPGGVQSTFKENFLCTVDLFRQSLGDLAKTLSGHMHVVQQIKLPSSSRPEAVAMYIPQVRFDTKARRQKCKSRKTCDRE